MSNPTVFVTRCANYQEQFPETFRKLMDATGWMTSTLLRGKRVLIKPNLLTDRTPEQAVTTHPAVLRHTIRFLKEAGAAYICVGDSPASTANLQAVLELSGIGAVCREEEVEVIRFEQTPPVQLERNGFSFALSQSVLDAELIVNLPKVKSHSLTLLTAAVKNLYGAVPGYTKTHLHRCYPKPNLFGKLLQAIWEVLPPVLSIADGVVGMEGQGPANGKPVQLGFLAASADAYALDNWLCETLHINRSRVPYLRDLGEGHTPIVKGDQIQVKSFEIPSGAHLLNLLPQWFVHLAGRILWVNPAFDPSRCVACGQCVKACPMKALTIPAGQKIPHLDRHACIGCACCHEICPRGAIYMTQSAILRMMKVFKGL